jgi:hypothetical protein
LDHFRVVRRFNMKSSWQTTLGTSLLVVRRHPVDFVIPFLRQQVHNKREAKGTDRKHMLGAVVGKALELLPSGKGVIQVLVTLQ